MASFKVRDFLGALKRPVMQESESDIGTALYAPPLHLFFVRLICAIVLLISWISDPHDDWAPLHWMLQVTILCSIVFFLLSACSLCVAHNRSLPRVFVSIVEALYFTAASVALASVFVVPWHLPALMCIFADFALVSSVRFRPLYFILPLLLHIPSTISELVMFGAAPSHILDMLGVAAASGAVFAAGRMKEHIQYEPSTYGAIL